jgi:hypothetical protein
MGTALIIAVVLAAVMLWLRFGLRAGPTMYDVELANGMNVEGLMFPLSEEVYVLQTEDRSLIVNARDIRGVDGKPTRSGVPVEPDDLVIVHETFEDILPSGEIDVRSAIRHRNTGSKPVRELRWGMAPHELDRLDTYRVLDIFGNSMPVRVVGEQENGAKWVQVDLRRPLFPGEETWYTTRYLEPNGILRQDGVWTYRHRGDYPDNRLVTRSVLVPEGAEILSIEPEPLYKVQMGGRWLVVWRRYFFRYDVVPWEIRFRPPAADAK